MNRDNATPSNPSRFVGHSKIKFTREGGLAVRVQNKTRGTSIKGQVCCASHDNDYAVDLCDQSYADPTCIVYDSGRPDGKDMWVVVAGFAEVALKDNEGSTRGYWAGISDEVGYAHALKPVPPAKPTHFRGIGHCIHSCVAEGVGTHVLCMMFIHLN